jgi:hypothetical protein
MLIRWLRIEGCPVYRQLSAVICGFSLIYFWQK